MAKTIDKFEVVNLGVTSPDYFQGFGVSCTEYTDCAYGIGATENEAWNDCIEQAVGTGRLDMDDNIVDLILRETWELSDDPIECECECDCDDCDCYSEQFYHIGLRWTVREERRLPIIRDMFPDVSRYEDYRSDGYDTVADGDIYLGDLHCADYSHDGELYADVPFTDHGDYCGSTVEKSNCRAFLEAFGHNDFVHRTYGGHGSESVMIGITGLLGCDDSTFDDIYDTLRGLADYPLIDEQLLCEIESEGCDDAWGCWVCSDYEKGIERAFPDVEFEFDGDKLRTVFEACAEKANEYWYCEGSGTDMYIKVDDVVEETTLEDVEDFAVGYDVRWNDAGEHCESYYSEEKASERAEELRCAGCMGAYFLRQV